ncbi:MAG: fumarylacetoacetate hydrolase family protein [Rhizobiales bacterium]|nr:fumarylacetoacetate hydrolase family protein [Hyphomicrobiales bacterium]MBI3674204.1 fumarylacetoacetate hydrolase family protein [Hyphomicrobiales bacterium]
MTDEQISSAAHTLLANWTRQTRIEGLASGERPPTRADGYAIATKLGELSGDRVAGWKIAATSEAGQRHINVEGPLAGRIYGRRLYGPDAQMRLGDNIMKVAEAEFAFRFARDLPARGAPYSREEALAAVGSLHLSIEVPDSRYRDFTKVGAAQLIADTACASWLALGPAVEADWRSLDLAAHEVTGHKNGEAVARGSGKAVLGDPRLALTWFVNEARQFCGGVRAGEFVTTGTCIVPIAIKAGDALHMDYGVLGSLSAQIV